MTDISLYTDKLTEYRNKLSAIQAEKGRLEGKISSIDSQITSVVNEMEEFSVNPDTIDDVITQLESEIADLTLKLDSLLEELDEQFAKTKV